MIIRSHSNIDIIQGVIGYGNATEGITDWRIHNSTTGVFNISNSSSIIRPSGGTSEIGEIPGSTDRYMIFKEGTSTFTVPSGGIKCDILVVGGGGCGGRSGGGGGAVIYTQNVYFPTGGYSVKVGNGGISLKSGSVGDTQGANGGDSDILFGATTIFSAKGGGFGAANYIQSMTGGTGGSGGGSENRDNIPTFTPSVVSSANIISTNTSSSSFTTLTNQSPNGITIYGNRGGIGGSATVGGNTGYSGGGGGGAGGVGGNFNASTLTSGAGGAGISINIIGTSIKYGSGGASGIYNGSVNATQGTSGTVDDGGGTGAYNMNTTSVFGSIPTPGRGGGGGGWGVNVQTGEQLYAKDGGSGIVIIRYYTANISIIDNGNVGIGITPISSSSKLEIFGDVNISGINRRNNRDIINDTSNYITITSNAIVPRIIADIGHSSNYVSRISTQLTTRVGNTSNYIAGTSAFLTSSIGSSVSSQWANITNGIHFTPTQSFSSITSTPVATTIGTKGDYTYQVFTYTTETAGAGTGQTQYTLTVPAGGIVCDILMVGGGGQGGCTDGGGGGGGGLVFIPNRSLASGAHIINVGSGGIDVGTFGVPRAGTNGYDTNINFGGKTLLVAKGGGGGGTGFEPEYAGVSGGSGGGAGSLVDDTTGKKIGGSSIQSVQFGDSGIFGYGNKGGDFNSIYGGGGGGGAGETGKNNGVDSTLGLGGNGLAQITRAGVTYNFKTHFGLSSSGIGEYISAEDKIYFAGGGGGGHTNNAAATIQYNKAGGKGGGGQGNAGGNGVAGLSITGGGGGGGGGGHGRGGNGGSGIVIIRYLSLSRNVGIGTINPESELHVYDEATNNTTLTVQNNYFDDIVISPNTFGYTAVETLESSKFYRTLTFNHFPNFPRDPPNTSLLAWYRFNGDGLDYSPWTTKYNLIANSGTPTYSSGTTADSFFQGRRYINTATGSLRSTTLALQSRAFSIALWMRTKNSSGSFFIAQSSSIGVNTLLHIGQRGNNSYSIDFYGNNLDSTSYAADINIWVHIVFVVLPNYNRRIYRNGVQIATDSNTAAFSGSGDLRIGADYNSNASQNVDISDLRIYTNGLSATEVAILYDSYTNLVITDNYNVTFNKSTTLLVNNVSRTVNGTYLLSMGHINSSMVPASGQSDTPLASTALTTLPIKYEYSNTAYSLPALITVSGATSSIIGSTERAISFAYTSDSAGLTGQTQYTFTTTEDLWCDILVVGGGGGGGKFGGGGGGGGVLLGTNLKINGGSSILIKVAKGGTGSTVVDAGINGTNGFDSSIAINLIEYIALGGGGGGSRASWPNYVGSNGTAGGSGGGGGNTAYGSVSSLGGISNKNNYANFQSFGNNGGLGRPNSTGSQPTYSSGGGGGAGSIGADFSYTTGGGNGGSGKDFIAYFGTNVGHFGYFAGGGGGNSYYDAGNRGYGNGGLGLFGGGGDGGYDGTLEYFAEDGLPNTGGGGGGSKYDGGTSEDTNGGNGGSGFVIIRYRKNQTQSSSVELITSLTITEPVIVAKQFPETPSTSTDTWTDNGFTVVCKTSDAILASQYNTGILFNNSIISPDHYHSTQVYNGGSPFNYTGSTSFRGANGLVIYIDLGRSITPRSMRFAPRDNASHPSLNFLTGMPGIFKIYASNNIASWTSNTDTSWIEIHSQTTSLTFNYNQFTEFGNFSTITAPYRYFALVVYNLTGSYGYLMMSEWDIFGNNIIPVAINNDYKYLSFTHSGVSASQTSYTVNFPENTLCDILVVGGGGGGGGGLGGGGGAGGVVYRTSYTINAGTYIVSVGAGGIGGSTRSQRGNSGNNSTFGNLLTALGGGGGGADNGTLNGLSGGSGGGGSEEGGAIGSIGNATQPTSASGGYGNNGGLATASHPYGSGGGGGAGGVGGNGGSFGGSGGIGILINITGSTIYYAGGGAGGNLNGAVSSGGLGGGGNTFQSGINNTGGGGGSAYDQNAVAGSGGSGIVIIRYRSTTGNQGYKIGNYNGDFKIISTLTSEEDMDFMRITRDGASIYNPTGSPLWSTVSDRRIKENIEKASYDKCFENINNLELYRFSYIKELNNINKDLKQLGYIAQEVQGIFPKAVSTQEFYNDNMSISDMLSIDVTQINYSLYGTVKKLIEMYNDIEKQISILENILKIDNTILNIPMDTSTTTSNITLDTSTTTSNITLDTSTSNITLDTSTTTSNITLDTSTTTSNITLDTSTTTSNITLDTSTTTSNITLDTSTTTSNL